MIDKLREAQKAMMPLVVLGVLALLAGIGITEDMTVGEAVSYAVASAMVWLVPNNTKK